MYMFLIKTHTKIYARYLSCIYIQIYTRYVYIHIQIYTRYVYTYTNIYTIVQHYCVWILFFCQRAIPEEGSFAKRPRVYIYPSARRRVGVLWCRSVQDLRWRSCYCLRICGREVTVSQKERENLYLESLSLSLSLSVSLSLSLSLTLSLSVSRFFIAYDLSPSRKNPAFNNVW